MEKIEKAYEYRVSAAGRVNLIGEHVDYCGGKVMPCALSLKNTVLVRRNGTDRINLAWTDLPGTVSLELGRLSDYRGLKHAKYHAGCAQLWREAGHKLVGCDLLLDCTVPFGSGLSSSAAIEVSTIAALATAAGEAFDKVEVALIAQKAEQVYAGVNCGIMDQFASANGKAGHAMLLDCNTLHVDYIPVELGDHALVIANCNKPHDLVVSKYNERREEVTEALRLLNGLMDRPAATLSEVSSGVVRAHRGDLPPVLYNRALHVTGECERVELAAKAMRAGNMEEFGLLLNASHDSLKDLYEVTGAELDALAYTARGFEGCLGSRMTGAGFGGCTVSLVKKGCEEAFKAYVAEGYERKTGYRPTFYPAVLSDGIVVEKL